MKIPHLLFVEHDSFTWSLLLWALTVPLYLGLQVWFGIAWKGRWRVVALIPLVGVLLTTILAVVIMLTTPDNQPFQFQDILVPPMLGVIGFAPFGLFYEVVASIVRLSRRRRVAGATA
jgi:uncharacterized integral membrane protein